MAKNQGKAKKSGAGKTQRKPVQSKLTRVVLWFFIIIVGLALVFIGTPFIKKRPVADPIALGMVGSFIEVMPGLNMRYVETGKGESIVFVHGFMSSADTWDKVTPALAKDHRVIALDLPGYGYSDKPEKFTYDYGGFANAVAAFMDVKEVKKAIVAGNSMGGGVAMQLALLRPDLVRGLVLIDSAGARHGVNNSNVMKTLMTTPGVLDFFHALNSKFFTRVYLSKFMYYDATKVTAEKVDQNYKPFFTKGAQNAIRKTIEDNDFTSLEGKMSEIKTPTLILWGENDKVIAPPVANVMKMRIRGARLVMFPECGHMPQDEKPEETVKEMKEFSASLK